MANRFGISKWAAFVVAFSGLYASGCGGSSGPPRFKVHGEVMNKGEPLKVKPMVGKVQVTFYLVTEPGQPAADPQEATILPTGEFTVHGTDGNGILPGKYKIAIHQWDEYPNKDVLQGKFDKEHTPITREISGDEEILLDVSKE